MEATITFSYESGRDVEAVARAVSPDNVKAPPGLTVGTTRRGSRVTTLVRCEGGLELFEFDEWPREIRKIIQELYRNAKGSKLFS